MSNFSKLAKNIIGSEIIKIASEVNQRIQKGEKIYNLTIGDFDPEIFSIPDELKSYIIEEIINGQTNYPPADGVLELRKSVGNLLEKREFLKYNTDEILIAAGARPIIYSIFRTVVDPDDKVIFAVPSWNNNHYTYLNFAQQIVIEANPENNFMPTAEDIRPYIGEVSLIALCSPQNPTGTTFTRKGLKDICELVIEENKKRINRKPVYLMYDQIYWELCLDGTEHYNPVSIFPEMKQWTIFVDGISKSLSATGVRVGWSFGPKDIISKMKSILTHIGAWAPKAEQVATSRYLSDIDSYSKFLESQKMKVSKRLFGLYDGLSMLKSKGYKVDVIKPQAGIYLTVKFGLKSMETVDGRILETTESVTKYLLDTCGLAIVPFYAFGTDPNSEWFRISVGTCKEEDIPNIISSLEISLSQLKDMQLQN